MSETIERFLSAVRDAAVRTFVQTGEIRPTFFMLTDDELIVVPTLGWANDFEKMILIHGIRVVAKREKATMVAIVTEGWQVILKPGEERGPSPANRPDREEVLWVCAQSASEDQGGMYKIIRSSPNAKPTLSAWEPMAHSVTVFDGMVGGRVLQ